MLDYRLVDYKPKINVNGTEYIDLLGNPFNYESQLTGNFIIINKYYVARPDLVSLAAYGDDKYADIICKLNGISNPFELNEDNLVFIPSLEYVLACIKNTDEESDLVSAPEDTIGVKMSSYQKKYTDTRSPNQQLVGEKNFVIDNSLGLVFY